VKNRGSILVVIMVTLVFTATALVAFLDKATTDLLVESRAIADSRLRVDAYSALEVTLAVLQDFATVDNGLRSPNEGWGTPLDWAGWSSPTAGHTVEVAFEDESGKIPLYNVQAADMLSMFENWNLTQNDAQHLTDVLLVWMRQSYIPTVAPSPDYEQSALPYDPPLRAMRTYDELADIDFARDLFYDSDGRRNDLWWRFYRDFSLFRYPKPNINGTNQDILVGLGQYTASQMDNVTDFLAGKGDFVTPNPLGVQWFQNGSQIRNVLGRSGKGGAFTTTISALRITVTVHEGTNQFRLSAVIASAQGGASTVQVTATDRKKNSADDQADQANRTAGLPGQVTPDTNASLPTTAQTNAATASALHFPFTILDIRENNDILTAPPPPVQVPPA
jgi:hypothetical protein